MLKVLYLIPKNYLSLIVGWLVSREHPRWLINLSVRKFTSFYQVDLAEAEHSLEHYPSIAKLFTRNLKPGVRPLESDVVCPVDGVLRTLEPVVDGCLWQVKGVSYSIAKLLGNADDANYFTDNCFTGGVAANFYLSPPDYHHIHAPLSGRVVGVTHIPGKLWPVNNWSLNHIKDLFCVNERVIVYLASDFGLCAVVMVGATNVGQIALSFDDSIRTNRLGSKGTVVHKKYVQTIDIAIGERLGSFHMGSSVLLLFERNIGNAALHNGTRVKYGRSLFSI